MLYETTQTQKKEHTLYRRSKMSPKKNLCMQQNCHINTSIYPNVKTVNMQAQGVKTLSDEAISDP